MALPRSGGSDRTLGQGMKPSRTGVAKSALITPSAEMRLAKLRNEPRKSTVLIVIHSFP
jgi:hypothetical protein